MVPDPRILQNSYHQWCATLIITILVIAVVLVVVALVVVIVVAFVVFACLGVTGVLLRLCRPGFSYIKFSISICIQ